MDNSNIQKINLSMEQSFPLKLHKRIMRQIYFIKHRILFLIMAAVVAVNFIVSGAILNAKLVEDEFWAQAQIMTQNLEFDSVIIFSAVESIFLSLPVYHSLFFLVSTILFAICSVFIYKFFKQYNLIYFKGRI